MTENKDKKRISYALARTDEDLAAAEKTGRARGDALKGAKEFFKYVKGEGKTMAIASIFIILNSIAGIITPFLVAYAIDNYINKGDSRGLLIMLGGLLVMYIFTSFFGYLQSNIVGKMSQRTLFRLRTELFKKIQDLPIAFFSQNKVGDLISRINNDTDKLNQFLSESLPRFVGSFFVIFGIGVFVLFLNWKLGLAMLSALLIIFTATKIAAPILERFNKKNLEVGGRLSSSIQENLSNFRVVAAYGKRDYFKTQLKAASASTFKNAYRADVSNRILEPIYDFSKAVAMLVVLIYGFHLIGTGALTVGLLIAFVSYTQRFYEPLQVMATIFGSIEISLAAWSRIRVLFNLENDLGVLPAGDGAQAPDQKAASSRLHFQNVFFGYEEGSNVLEEVSFSFEAGKTYALVGPTGGGKTTLSSLMARLYDPVSGAVFLDGKDIRTFTAKERTDEISVILQDPILFTGTVAENIRYGNESLDGMDNDALTKTLQAQGLGEIMARFSGGLETPINSGSGLSLGQKQLISFMRAVLRKPKLLILDEATANIDTITEALLTKALEALPADTTKVIIAHRLNTIKDADEILFVNKSHVVFAGNFDEAVRLIGTSGKNS